MKRNAPSTPLPAQDRASTGIPGLDDVLGGGLPVNHLYLVEGNPGSGKTTLALQFLREGALRGEKGLYVTLSETARELNTVAASHGWTLDGIEIFELVSDEGLTQEAEQSILHPSEVELGETVRGVMAAVERIRPQRVIFDSLSEMRLLAQNALRYRRQVLALKRYFSDHACTVILLDDRTSMDIDSDQPLHSIAHGVISMDQTVDQYGPERRRLRVVKMRGIRFRGGEHDFVLETGGISVFPRLVAAEHRMRAVERNASTGNAQLDAVLGGGLPCGSNTLFCGPSGVGKTTTALACVVAALRRGERAAYYLFDEGPASLVTRARAFGLDIEEYIAGGQLQLVPLDPAEVSPGEFVHMVRDAVEEGGAGTVVIDSLNAYLQSMPGSKYLMLQMHELLSYLNHRNTVTILVLGQHGIVGELQSDIDISYLSDAVLLFRYFEANGRLLKALSMIKSRVNRHEQSIREFRLGREGLELGEQLTDFEGVISGVPTYSGRVALLGSREGGR